MEFSSLRDTYFNMIYDFIKNGEDILIVSSDLGAPSLDKFRRDFGKRFVNVGIAEQNLIAVASGIALTGKKVIAYGLNPFPVTRAFDQLRNTLSSLNLPITLAVFNAGLCSAQSGATHFAIEDLNIIRTLPRIKIINVSDYSMAKKAAFNTVCSSQPSLIRFDKQITEQLYKEEEIDFNCGFSILENGKNVAIVTTGYYLSLLRKNIDRLKNNGIDVMLIDCYAIPVNEEKLANTLNGVNLVITVEENCLRGGLGSMILELLADREIQKPIKRFGLDFREGYPKNFGDRNYFLNSLGLDIDYIFKEIIKFYLKYS